MLSIFLKKALTYGGMDFAHMDFNFNFERQNPLFWRRSFHIFLIEIRKTRPTKRSTH